MRYLGKVKVAEDGEFIIKPIPDVVVGSGEKIIISHRDGDLIAFIPEDGDEVSPMNWVYNRKKEKYDLRLGVDDPPIVLGTVQMSYPDAGDGEVGWTVSSPVMDFDDEFDDLQTARSCLKMALMRAVVNARVLVREEIL